MLEAIKQRSQRGYCDYSDPDWLKSDVAYLLGYITREQQFKEEVANSKMAYIMNANKEGFDAFRKV